MADYRQTDINGTSWQRAYRVECENPYEGSRHITFHEEAVLNVGEQVVRSPAGSLTIPFSEANADTAFDLLNPLTGEVIGTATYAQAYALLHSLYIHGAVARDTAAAQVPEPAEPIPDPAPVEDPFAEQPSTEEGAM